MQTTLYENADGFAQLRADWNPLLQRSISNLFFLTWEWQVTWWNAYQAGELWVIALHEGETLVGIAPWFIQNREGERVVRTIGCVDVTDYVDIIAEPAHLESVQAALGAFLLDNAHHYDRVNLCNIPESSPTVISFPERLRTLEFDAETELQEVCPVIALPNSWESYLESLDKKQRHEIRRKLRRCEGEAELEYTIVGKDHDLESETDRFLAMMAASQPSKAEFLTDARNDAFFRAMVRVTFDQGWLRMSFLKVNGVYCAAYCDFDYNGQILVYNSGLLPENYAHLSPGIVLLAYNIRAAIESGHTIYDFLRGNETYKYRMGAVDTRVFKLLARVREPVPQL